ncbi:MAG TPA: hypothetical protein VM146_01640 [Steroidobacteraceae bacterium]|nr:hypothetical protein [Steroidobacteraceae bacterium]
MTYDEETLMAYADGELDAASRAEIAAAIEQDPELAGRVAKHRALRTEVAGALSSVIDQSVPERLRAAARGPLSAAPPAPEARPRGNVVQFPSRGSHAPGAPWRAREWTAMAASLVLGGLIGWHFMARSTGDVTSRGGALVARGELAEALDKQLASDQANDASVRIGLSFKSKDGSYCRSFVSRASSAAGLACRKDSDWQLAFTEAIDPEAGGVRQAASELSPSLLKAVEARMAGDTLDANGERTARDAAWQ